MELTTETNQFVVVKGFIDARDSNARPVRGAFVSVSGYQKTLYFKEIFTNDPIDRTLSWPELLAMLNGESEPPFEDENSVLEHYREKFREFISVQRLLEYGRGRLDAKEIERRITYFCTDVLGLSTVTFLELTMMGDGELLVLMPFLSEKLDGTEGNDDKDPDDNDASNSGDPADAEEDGETQEQNEIFLSCEPLLDPISGVAVSNLSIGDLIAAKLPETSSFYQLFIKQYPSFDGIIEGRVTGIKINEYDMSVVALKLADGVSGTLKLSGKVRIKRLVEGESIASRGNARFPVEILFAALSVVVFLIVMSFLLYTIN